MLKTNLFHNVVREVHGQCVSADAHHTLLDGPNWSASSTLLKKVNATFWPVYASIALREHSCPAYPLLKFPKQGVETIEVVQSAHADYYKDVHARSL